MLLQRATSRSKGSESAPPAVRGALRATLRKQALLLGFCLGVLWGVEIVDRLALGGALDRYGIEPRTLHGLRGVPLAPLLHGSFDHLIANTMPFLVLGWLVMLRGLGTFFRVSAIVIFISGLGVWCTASSSAIYVGASGLIFGYLGYLMLRGYFDRSAFSVAVSLLVGIYYGSLIWGVLPISQEGSWVGHLWGFIGGTLCAWLLTRQPRTILEIRL